jgi:acetolactate synthase-1/2/3 large subunit
MGKVLRGADILTQTLSLAGVRHLFSLSGNQIMPVYDAAIDCDLNIIHVRHEAAAVHMADAWGRLTGEPGIALVTGGPGHANALGALYTARAADSPLVLLSGHAPLGQLGMDAFQEMAQADLAAPLVKASWTAQAARTLGADIARALRIASSGRPGPVHVSLPFDVLEQRCDQSDSETPGSADCRALALPLSGVAAQSILAQVADAERPLFITGPFPSQSRSSRERAALAAATGVPVVPMESPRGVNDPALGAAAEVLASADLVVLIGKKLDFTLRFGRAPAFASGCRLIMIDPEPQAFQRAAHACGDAAKIVQHAIADSPSSLRSLTAAAKGLGMRPRQWSAEVDAACRYRPPAWAAARNSTKGPLHPLQVGAAVQRLVDAAAESVVVVDGGEYGQWAQACIEADTRLINGPAGSIGSGVPFALAARLARPNATVFAMLGDGTLGFHLAEFDTAVRNNLPVVALIGNDACWNAEHQIQLSNYGLERAVGCELLPTRYEQSVAGLGGHGEFVTRVDELAPALGRALDSGKPSCVNVLVERLPAPTVARAVKGAGAGSH